MTTLLVINTSPRKDAVSRCLTERFIERWSAVSPTGKVLHRDIGAAPPEHLDDELIDALVRNPEVMSLRQAATRAASNAMIAEMQNADAIVIGAPMHNFTVTGTLRTWIDHIARPGKTFGYDPETGRNELLDDKPVVVISTRGGEYGNGDPVDPNPADFLSPYLRHIFGFMGLKDVRTITANGLDMGPESRAEGLAVAEAKIDAAVAVICSPESGS